MRTPHSFDSERESDRQRDWRLARRIAERPGKAQLPCAGAHGLGYTKIEKSTHLSNFAYIIIITFLLLGCCGVCFGEGNGSSFHMIRVQALKHDWQTSVMQTMAMPMFEGALPFTHLLLHFLMNEWPLPPQLFSLASL